MVKFALIGAGTIGRMHAANLVGHPEAELISIYDVNPENAQRVADECGARACPDLSNVLEDVSVEAVLIASSTATHASLIAASTKAGKHVLCEKPIDLDIFNVNRCREEIASTDVVVQVGFNRRFDPSHAELRDSVAAGEVGDIEMIVISSRDPQPQPLEYLAVSGGIFRDQMIHDFDMARFILGKDEATHLAAFGSVKIQPALEELGDVDTAMVTLCSKLGVLVNINNSRRAVYGYDQRIEVFGSKGMIVSDNHRVSSVVKSTAEATDAKDPLMHFYIERYADSYRIELDRFIDSVRHGTPSAVTFEDGRRALVLANAATESFRTGKRVPIEFGN